MAVDNPAGDAFDVFLREPARAWSSRHGAESAIEYSVAMRANTDALVKALAPTPLSIPIRSIPENVRYHVLLTHTRMRIEHEAPGLFGGAFIYLEDNESGRLYIDTDIRRYLHLDPEQTLSGPRDLGVEVLAVRQVGEGHEIELRIPGSPVEMTLITVVNEALAPFESLVMAAFFGCPQSIADCGFDLAPVSGLGMLAEGEVRAIQDGRDAIVVSQFELLDMQPTSIDDSAFDIPAGFEDWRDVSARGPKDRPTFGLWQGRWNQVRPTRKSRVGARQVTAPVRPTTLDWNNTMSILQHPSWLETPVGAITAPSTGEYAEVPCLPSTRHGTLAMSLRQALLDDLATVVNRVTSRLGWIRGDEGIIKFDWLEQMRQTSAGLNGGDGLYCFLRDDSSPPPGSGGLLDRLAENLVAEMLASGTLILQVPAEVQQAVTAVMSNLSIVPNDRYRSLSTQLQVALREAYLQQKLATLSIRYPETTQASDIIYDLLTIKAFDISFWINLNHADDVLRSLRIMDDGIVLEIEVPEATFHAMIAHHPSAFFATVSAFTPACLFVPHSCWAFSLMAAIPASFLTDVFFVDAQAKKLNVRCRVEPNASETGLVPRVATVSIDIEDLDVATFSWPVALNNLKNLVLQYIFSVVDDVLHALESELKDSLTKLLKDDFAIVFPPDSLRGNARIEGTRIESVNDDHLYLEVDLSPAPEGPSCPFVTLVDEEIYENLQNWSQTAVPPWDQVVDYAGLALTQNYLNLSIYELWRRGGFSARLAATEEADFRQALRQSCATCGVRDDAPISIWAAVPPRFVLTPRGFRNREHMSVTFFDDMRVCVEGGKGFNTVELQFACLVESRIGFFGPNEFSGRLDPAHFGERLLGIYFAVQSDTGVQVIHPSLQELTSVSNNGGDPFTYASLPALQGPIEEAMRSLLSEWSTAVLPDEDGGASPSGETYLIGSGGAGSIVTLSDVRRGNMYTRFSWQGIVAAMIQTSDSALDPGGISCAEGAGYRPR